MSRRLSEVGSWIALLMTSTAAITILGNGCGASVESYGEGDKILRWMKASGTEVSELKASAALLQKSPKGTFRGDVYIFFKAPSSIRIDILGPADNLVTLFASKEGRGLLLDYTHLRAARSSDASCLLAKFLGIQVALPDMSALFIGHPPIVRFGESALAWHPKGYYVLTLKDPAGTVEERLQLVHGKFGTVAIRAVIIKDGKKVVDMSFRERGWSKRVPTLMPRIIEVGFTEEKLQLMLKYRSVDIDARLPEDTFDVPVPSDFTEETVEGCDIF